MGVFDLFNRNAYPVKVIIFMHRAGTLKPVEDVARRVVLPDGKHEYQFKNLKLTYKPFDYQVIYPGRGGGDWLFLFSPQFGVFYPMTIETANKILYLDDEEKKEIEKNDDVEVTLVEEKAYNIDDTGSGEQQVINVAKDSKKKRYKVEVPIDTLKPTIDENDRREMVVDQQEKINRFKKREDWWQRNSSLIMMLIFGVLMLVTVVSIIKYIQPVSKNLAQMAESIKVASDNFISMGRACNLPSASDVPPALG